MRWLWWFISDSNSSRTPQTEDGITVPYFFNANESPFYFTTNLEETAPDVREEAGAEFELYRFVISERRSCLKRFLMASVPFGLACSAYQYLLVCGVLLDGEPASSKRTLDVDYDSLGDCLASAISPSIWVMMLFWASLIMPLSVSG